MSTISEMEDSRVMPTDFEQFLPWACKELGLTKYPVITRQHQEILFQAKGKPVKKSLSKSNADLATHKTDLSSTSGYSESYSESINSGVIVNIITLYDQFDDLVKVKFVKNTTLPRELLKVVGLAVPFHKNLTSIVIDSGVTDGIVYEIAKLLPNSCITEVCLDGAFVERANYDVLLDTPHIKHLSLSRCKITDMVVKSIVAKISYPDGPSMDGLCALNLASNKITDVGMKYVGYMLRGNRKLSYLNISDNRITDKGAFYIFDILKLFPLTHEEVVQMKGSHMSYLNNRTELIKKMIETFKEEEEKRKASPTKQLPRRKSEFKGKSVYNVTTDRAESTVNSVLGPFEHPFSKEMTCPKNHCLGNNVLCYINFAYNHLTYLTVKKLLDVVVEQQRWTRKPRGLINVNLEGNKLPEFCKEYNEIDEIFTAASMRDNIAVSKRRSVMPRSRTEMFKN